MRGEAKVGNAQMHQLMHHAHVRVEQQLAAMLREGEKSVPDWASETRVIAKNGEIGNGRSSCVHNTATRGATNADYLTARIKRDRPDILARMKAGEFRLAKLCSCQEKRRAPA